MAAGQTATVSGGGLSWSLVRRANAQPGDSEIWAAPVAYPTTSISVTATVAQGGMNLSLTVLGVRNATVGTSAGAGAGSGPPAVSFTSTAAGSVGVAVGNDYDYAISRTVGGSQSLLSQWLDTALGDTYWSQYTTVPTTTTGQTVTLNDPAPTQGRWNLAAVELKATGSGTAALSAPTTSSSHRR